MGRLMPVMWRQPDDGSDAPLISRIAAFAVVFLLVSALFWFAFSQLQYGWNWHAVWQYRQKFLQGWLVTVLISAAALTLSLLISIFFALARRSRLLPLRYLAMLYVEVVRGTPLLVQILVFFYVVADAFGVSNRYAVGILTLALFAGAYLSEIIRAGIESVGESQLESAQAIGLTTFQTYRFVIIPQVVRRILPPLAGQFASLIKDSSLLSIIAVSEFTLNAQEINSFTFSTLESYLPLAVGYLLLTLPISLFSRYLEQKYRYAT